MRRNDKKYTINDIARYTGVGISTVSRVLNKTTTKIAVTEKTKQRIWDAVKQFDYAPDINAQRLSSRKSYVLALIVPAYRPGVRPHAFTDHTIIEALRGVEDAILKTKYKLLLIFKNDDFIEQKEYLKLFREKSIDGMIIWGASFKDNYISELAGYPVMVMNAYNSEDDKVSYVGHDNLNASFKMTEYLIKKGYRNFCYIGARLGNSIAKERREGVMQALKKHNIKLRDENIFEGDFYPERAYEIMDGILTGKKHKFDAVITVNDSTALGVYRAALAHGKKISGDFALVGGDGVDCFGEEVCPLTTFRVDCFKMGRIAIEKLIDQVEGRESKAFKILLDTELIIRKTA